MSHTLYLECYAGISGDMAVAALLDLGAGEETLRRSLDSIAVEGFSVHINRVKKSGLDACDFAVELDKMHENHDHDMEYLHGHNHEHGHNHDHGHSHEHNHGHVHEHRGLREVLEIIDGSAISKRAKETAARIFTVLARAEAEVHGVETEKVHFHEVGAVDSIVDIIAFAVCLDDLDITEVIVPKLYEGRGTIRCQHGIIPVPAPAVSALAQAHGLKFHITDVEGELVTPTGAAIVAAVRTSDRLPEAFRIKKTGMGAGKREYRTTGVLRAMLIEPEEQSGDCIVKLETNIDDCSGENLGYVMDRLFAAGARDVYYTPVFMKKNRPAYLMSVVCREKEREALERIIFENTTTIGIRRTFMERSILEREEAEVSTSLGKARVKICTFPDGDRRIYPEYESVSALCGKCGMSYGEVYSAVQLECAAERGMTDGQL